MQHYTEILEGRLWVGSIRSVAFRENLRELKDSGLKCVLSVLPIGKIGGWSPCQMEERVEAHRILFSWDDTELEPVWIERAIDLDVPTLIHCNSGKNRSTAIAACWLLRHHSSLFKSTLWTDEAIEMVKSARDKTRGTPADIYPEMRENVKRYWHWLVRRAVAAVKRAR